MVDALVICGDPWSTRCGLWAVDEAMEDLWSSWRGSGVGLGWSGPGCSPGRGDDEGPTGLRAPGESDWTGVVLCDDCADSRL